MFINQGPSTRWNAEWNTDPQPGRVGGQTIFREPLVVATSVSCKCHLCPGPQCSSTEHCAQKQQRQQGLFITRGAKHLALVLHTLIIPLSDFKATAEKTNWNKVHFPLFLNTDKINQQLFSCSITVFLRQPLENWIAYFSFSKVLPMFYTVTGKASL